MMRVGLPEPAQPILISPSTEFRAGVAEKRVGNWISRQDKVAGLQLRRFAMACTKQRRTFHHEIQHWPRLSWNLDAPFSISGHAAHENRLWS
jgi:hypothetical protein